MSLIPGGRQRFALALMLCAPAKILHFASLPRGWDEPDRCPMADEGRARSEKTTSIGCTIHRASEATMFLMISGDVAVATQPSSGRKGDRLRWKEPARVASLYILASCALSFSRLRRQLPPQGACRFARYSQGLYLVTIFNRRAGVLLPPIQNR